MRDFVLKLMDFAGEALPWELYAKVKDTPKACTHFFGGEMGCTMGDKCRFLHALP